MDQGGQITLTAVVTDASGNTPPGTLQYAWSANRGSFAGATDEASAVYQADFTETVDVPVMVTCRVTRAANANPTSAGASLTALAEIGVTGILVNMFMTALGAVSANTNSVLYNASTGTLDTGSDQRLSSNLNIFQLRWDNQTGFNHFVLNNNEGGNIGDFFRNNNNQSVYIIFEGGTYEELTPTDFANANSAGGTWARWEVTDAAILALLNGLTSTDDLVVGVGDTGSIGWTADSGSDTEMFTTAAVAPLTIEAIDEQSIPVLTKDYELEIDIGGEPTRAYVDGDMEGFYHTWSASDAKIRIKSEQVTRLISGALWNVHLVKGTRTLDSQITYNVVPSAPVIADPGAQKLHRGYRFSLDIAVANRPTIARGSALLTGLKYGPRADGADGLNIAGRLPKDVNLTEAAFRAAIYAENNGGADNLAVPFAIEDVDVYGVKIHPNTALHRIRLNDPDADVTSLASATIDPALSLTFLAADTDYFYVTSSGGHIWRISRPLTDGDDIVLGTAWKGVGTTLIRGIAVDENYLYVVDTRRPGNDYKGMIVLNRSDGVQDRRFGFPADGTIGRPRGVVVHGDSLIVCDDDDDHALYWMDKNTLANERAPITKTVNLPSGEYRDIAILSDSIFITATINDQIYEIDVNLADGTTLTEFDLSYDVPSAMQNLSSITIG